MDFNPPVPVRSEKKFHREFVSQAIVQLPLQLRVGAVAMTVFGHVGFPMSHMGQQKVLIGLILETDIIKAEKAPEGHRLTGKDLVQFVFGEQHTKSVPTSMLSAIETSFNGAGRYLVGLSGSTKKKDVYLQRMEFDNQVIATKALPPEVPNQPELSSLEDVGALLSKFQLFADAKTVDEALSLNKGEKKSSPEKKSLPEKKSSPVGMVVQVQDQPPPENGETPSDNLAVDNSVQRADVSQPKPFYLPGFEQRPPVPKTDYNEFPNRSKAMVVLRAMNDARSILVSAGALLEHMLKSLLGPHSYDMKFWALVDEYSNLPCAKDTTVEDLKKVSQWFRNPFSHVSPLLLPDWESLGTNKFAMLYCIERLFSSLEQNWESKQENESLQSRVEQLEEEVASLSSQLDDERSKNSDLNNGDSLDHSSHGQNEQPQSQERQQRSGNESDRSVAPSPVGSNGKNGRNLVSPRERNLVNQFQRTLSPRGGRGGRGRGRFRGPPIPHPQDGRPWLPPGYQGRSSPHEYRGPPPLPPPDDRGQWTPNEYHYYGPQPDLPPTHEQHGAAATNTWQMRRPSPGGSSFGSHEDSGREGSSVGKRRHSNSGVEQRGNNDDDDDDDDGNQSNKRQRN